MTRRLVVVWFLMFSCGGAELEGRSSALRALNKKARDNGAYRCAPRELALAESHTAFAEQELAEGDYFRAKQELSIAEDNAQLAIDRSPREKCNPNVEIADTSDLVVERLDSDKDGLFDDEDACPQEAEDKDGFQDEDGCPDPDNDKDGILDGDDKCPLEPEDIDGFEDADGCPDPDNDGDGLNDAIDKCPNEAEDKDGFEDDDGCPDIDNDKDKVLDKDDKCPDEFAETPDGCPQKYQLVVVTATKIELKQTVFFRTGKAAIKRQSFALLNEVALALKDHPDMKVRVEGHTDSVGSNRSNRRLSQKRAESVRKYIVAQGVDGDRLTPKGYGEEVPIADNRSKQGRQQNRRVEFVIISQ